MVGFPRGKSVRLLVEIGATIHSLMNDDDDDDDFEGRELLDLFFFSLGGDDDDDDDDDWKRLNRNASGEGFVGAICHGSAGSSL